MTLILDEELRDVSGLLDAVFEEMRPWAETHGFGALTNAFLMGTMSELDAMAGFLMSAGLPVGWDCLGAVASGDRRLFVVRTDSAAWVLLAVEMLSPLGTVVRPLVVEETLGRFGDYLFGTRLHSLRPLLEGLLGQCPFDDGEDAEQMLDALVGLVYIPRSAYAPGVPVRALPSLL